MINRFQYMTRIVCPGSLSEAIEADRTVVDSFIRSGRYISVSVFSLDDMLFLYCETEGKPSLGTLMPAVTAISQGWRLMDNVYYTGVPISVEQWARPAGKKPLCRIGKLVPDKVDSYKKYHSLYMEEGIRKGDKYLCIALLGTTLFLYYESPEEPTCLRPDRTGESQVQKDWIKQNPPGHFDHSFSGEGNFITLKAILTAGVEDIYE